METRTNISEITSKKNIPQEEGPVSQEHESLPYVIKKSDTMGRFLVASRDLSEGTVIISEAALVVGPAQDSHAVCLGCYSPLPHVSSANRCKGCRWPLCSDGCNGLHKRHGHSKEECATLASCEVGSTALPASQMFNAVVPLRCLLLKQHHPEDWRTLMTMEPHNDIRRTIPSIWDYNQKSVVDRIIKEWNLTAFSEEEIHTVCGILEVNAFAVGDESLNIRGVYPTAFFIAHSCVSNTSHTDDKNFCITIFSSLHIPKDETIFLSYANSLQGTKLRRQHLNQCKFFDCDCQRCKDPTELGTYLSGVKCSECRSGHFLPSDPLSLDAVWLCDNNKCSATSPAQVIDSLTTRIDTEIKQISDKNIEELESRICRYSKVLHKNHYLILGIKFKLSQIYGKAAGFLIHEMSDTNLQRKQEICQDILKIFDIIEPGMTPVRALTMYEIHAPIMVMTIKRFEMRQVSKVDLCGRLRRVVSYLKECCRILRFESEGSHEAGVRAAAEEALAQLKSWEPLVGKI